MTPLEYLLFALNMAFLLCYLFDFDNLSQTYNINYYEDSDANRAYYTIIDSPITQFGLQPTIMFTIQLVVLMMFTLKMSLSASYLINAQLFDEDKIEELWDEMQ